MTSAIVLCGGSSKRMGRDKASLPFGPESLLARVVARVRPAVAEVVLVASEGQVLPPVPTPYVMAHDAAPGLGPLSGLVAGLRAMHGRRACLVACDMPFLQPALVARLLELSEGYDACAPRIAGRVMTTCAIYDAAVVEAAQALVAHGRLSLLGLLDDVRVRYVSSDDFADVDAGLVSFRDCDTTDAYAAALRDAGFAT